MHVNSHGSLMHRKCCVMLAGPGSQENVSTVAVFFALFACLKYCAFEDKMVRGRTKWCALTQNHFSKAEKPMLQNATCSWWACVLYCACHARYMLQILFKIPTFVTLFRHATKHSSFVHLWQGAEFLAPAMQNQIWTSKSGRNMLVLMFWLGNVFRTSVACTFLMCQLAARMRCLMHFDLEICFTPQQRDFFEISPSKNCPNPSAFFTVLTSTCVSRHNGLQFFIFHLARCSVPAAVAMVLFDPSRATNHGPKNIVLTFAIFLTHLFAHLDFFYFFFLSSSFFRLFPSLPLICPRCQKFDV